MKQLSRVVRNTPCLSGYPAFGWLCVVCTITDIAFRAAQIRAAQALPKSPSQVPPAVARESKSCGGPTKPHSIRVGINTRQLLQMTAKRLVSKLSQMRGAALKLGQFMSIQDTHILPPEVDKIFRRVQDSFHYMPDWQMEVVPTSYCRNNFISKGIRSNELKDRTIQVMKDEPADDNSPGLLGQDPRSKIPWVWGVSTDRVLVMDRRRQRRRVVNLSPSTGGTLQNASSSYLFQFRLMQTDQLLVELCDATGLCSVDFGAACEYTKEFMDNWLHLLQAAARELPQNETIHTAAIRMVTTSLWDRVNNISRKLSGAFLLASRLGAVVDAKRLWARTCHTFKEPALDLLWDP
ncbi:hypothetical protein EV363DRAFT_1473643 [Boletus edulis]|nr:hypothetical protein EV363DRAFT_1473643 [Boletus edulis]